MENYIANVFMVISNNFVKFLFTNKELNYKDEDSQLLEIITLQENDNNNIK